MPEQIIAYVYLVQPFHLRKNIPCSLKELLQTSPQDNLIDIYIFVYVSRDTFNGTPSLSCSKGISNILIGIAEYLCFGHVS